MDVSHCRPSMDERTGLCVNPAAMMMRLLESHHLVGPRHQLAVVLEALVLRVWLVAALMGVFVSAVAAVLAVLLIAREEVGVLVAQHPRPHWALEPKSVTSENYESLQSS